MKEKTYDYDGYKIYTIQTDKFKNCYIEVNFREDARLVNVTKRNLLCKLMSYTSLKYPTKREMRIATEELYNLAFGSGVNRSGYNLFTGFSIDFLNPKFAKEKKYLEDSIAFLFEIIENPHISKDSFSERSFAIIKERMRVQLNQYKEKPLSYAVVHSKQELFGDSISGVRLSGNIEELEPITKEEMVDEYKSMMQNSHCDILIIGDMDMDFVVSIIKKYFHKPSIVSDEIPFQVENKIQNYREVVVDSPYHQTQVLLLYQMESMTNYERNFVAPIFQMILGDAGMTDKLKKYLREDHSLCYQCGCMASGSDLYGILYAMITYENAELTLKYMRKAVEEMVDGDIEPDFFESVKNKFLSDLRLREDSIYGLIDNYYFHEIAGRALFSEYVVEIPKITIEDICKFSSKLHESLLYILKEESKNETN